jgi:ATP-dependent Clp protease ATP-binding subunit ClpA
VGEEVTSGQIPFTPRAKKVLELALREALSLGHNYIGTEHILLGLVCENGGVAARILLDFDADSEKIRAEVIRALSGPGGPSGPTSEELDALLDGAQVLLGILGGEIEERLGRPADAGDLLVALASIPAGLAARTLASVGVDAEALARAGAEARRSGARSGLLPPLELVDEIEKVRTEKNAAIQTAAGLRDRERELTEQTRKTVEQQQEQVLNEVRSRLGLAHE